MTCDDNRCLPPTDVDFSISLAKGSEDKKVGNSKQNEDRADATQRQEKKDHSNISIMFTDDLAITGDMLL